MLPLRPGHNTVFDVFRGLQAGILNADWLEGAHLVSSPDPIYRLFNYHKESRTFYFLILASLRTLSQDTNQTHYITALLAANAPSA